jgi:hypothetical protein
LLDSGNIQKTRKKRGLKNGEKRAEIAHPVLFFLPTSSRRCSLLFLRAAENNNRCGDLEESYEATLREKFWI